jgi:esterase/lipase superfamily enzyme
LNFHINARHRIQYRFLILLTCLISIAGFLVAPIAKAENTKFRLERQERDPAVRNMLFATTRLDENGGGGIPYYTGRRHLDFGRGSIDYGSIKVRRPGQLKSIEKEASWQSYLESMKENDGKWEAASIASVGLLEENDFFSKIHKWKGSITVFIHGYLKSFDNSIRDAAVVAYELDRRNGWENQTLPILFTWPSANKLQQYSQDETNCEWSAQAFSDFIEKLAAEKNESSTINVVAHSLGTRLVFALTNNPSLVERAPIDKLILSASDYDYFSARQRLEKLEGLVKNRIFVFVSDRDGPLITSHLLHGAPRLGRPFDAPVEKTNPHDYLSMDAWAKLFDQAAEIVIQGGLNNPPEAAVWLSKRPEILCELGKKSKFIDVSELVSKDAGHRLAWPLISSLLIDDNAIAPLKTTVVYKRPDQTTLLLNGGIPPQLYRFHRVNGATYGTK